MLGYKWRAVEALFIGAVVGAAAVAALYAGALLQGAPSDRHAFVPFVVLVFVFAFAGWAIGLVAVAAPLWWMLDKVGARSWRSAFVFGALAAFSAHIVLDALGFRIITPAIQGLFSSDHSIAPSGLWSVYPAHIVFAGIGAVVALVVWRIAYRSSGAGDGNAAGTP